MLGDTKQVSWRKIILLFMTNYFSSTIYTQAVFNSWKVYFELWQYFESFEIECKAKLDSESHYSHHSFLEIGKQRKCTLFAYMLLIHSHSVSFSLYSWFACFFWYFPFGHVIGSSLVTLIFNFCYRSRD